MQTRCSRSAARKNIWRGLREDIRAILFDYGKTFAPVISDLFLCNQPAEMLEGTVIRSFGIHGKTATRKLPALQVVLDALATDAAPGAFALAAATFFGRFFLPAFHQ
jgi:hypothetical protein